MCNFMEKLEKTNSQPQRQVHKQHLIHITYIIVYFKEIQEYILNLDQDIK